jgi:hypothetical protein
MKITDIKIKSTDITSENYENIFNIYTDEDGFYYYNLLRKVDFPDDLDSNVYDYYETKGTETYPNIAYDAYKSVKLWWIVCAANQIDDPTKQPTAGTLLKIIKPSYIRIILARMRENE